MSAMHGSTAAILPPKIVSLTPKQRTFILEYLKGRNGVAAARVAGYKGNYNTLHSVAVENLQKPAIRKALEELAAPALERAQVTIDRVVERLATIAFAPWRRSEAPPEALVPLPAVIQALRLLGEYLGMFDGKGDISQHPRLEFPSGEITAEKARQELLRFLRSQHKRR